MSKDIPYERSFASHPKSIFWSEKNGDVKPENVSKSSNVKFWFNCEKCNHTFDCTLNHITNSNRWCSYCANKKLCDNENCNICFDKSYASNPFSQNWSDKNKVNSRNVLLNSHKKFWFNCFKCLHVFTKSLDYISDCPFCSNQKLCEDENCNLCFQKSFASNNRSQNWSDKNELQPRNVFKNTAKMYWFNCNICNHKFKSSLANVSQGNWCPYCAVPSKKLCEDKNCNLCLQKSFLLHDKVKYWSDKNTLKPRDVFKGSQKKYWFNCDKNDKHVFEISIKNIIAGKWCPFCVNKTETKLYELLTPIYSSFNRQFKVDWCKQQNYLPFDFVIKDYRIIIELDGEQHFKQVSNWKSPEIVQENDLYKMKCANENGYSVIRLLQDDVFKDKYNWLDELKNNITKIINEQKVQNIFMSKNNEYDKLKQSINWQN